MALNKTLVFASVVTLVQAAGQIFFTSFSIAQYYCLIDFLQEIPLVVFIRILYVHNPTTCGASINIGHAVEGIANQALVLLQNEPFTATRTFIINCLYLGLCSLWLFTSVIMLMGGAKNKPSKHIRWPWVVTTVFVSILDMVAVVMYANDSFHTRTLTDAMDYIGGMVSGIGNTEIATAMVSWTMVLIYSRLGVLFALNLCLIVVIIIDCGLIPNKKNTPPPQIVTIRTADESVQADVPEPAVDIEAGESIASTSRQRAGPLLPRPGISHSFRRMKELLFRRPSTPSFRYVPSSGPSTPTRTPQTQRSKDAVETKSDTKRTVNFPVNLLSLPQRLENLIAEQQQRLDQAVVDTSGRGGDNAGRSVDAAGQHSPPRASQSLPQLANNSLTDSKGRRGTAADLQRQLPWAYIPAASAHPMREQLPPDEELPPVPLPDYTAISSFRKASVHRAASSLSSLTHKKDYHANRHPLNQSDVLY